MTEAAPPPVSRLSAKTCYPDALYGEVRVAAWAESLLATPALRRLAGVSLSDVPGELLFGRPFPSRLDHTRGVYHLARLARPRDRALQAAALTHDLGHGPFSHLTEPLMRERLGADHEQRSARLLADVRAALPGAALRRLAWLDWDEVAQLILGGDGGGRGELLNGRLDYDNDDNVARFLAASGLGTPAYDPRTLARALRLLPPGANAVPPTAGDTARADGATRVYLLAGAAEEGRGWQTDRALVYGYLHEGHENLSLHAMLRKAIDLAALEDLLPSDFFDLTDAQALEMLRRAPDPAVALLAERFAARMCYRCVWEGWAAGGSADIEGVLAQWRARLALETRLGEEVGLPAHYVIVEMRASSAGRALPPLGSSAHPEALEWLPAPTAAPTLLHLFVPPATGSDYARRLRGAAGRHFAVYGIAPLGEGT